MATLQLYDQGEEKWPRKLHVGCGTVFLEGYENSDAQGHLAADRSDLVKENWTTVGDYYGRRASYVDIFHIPPRAEIVVDRLADMARLDYGPNTVDKILCVQTFEHITPGEAELALARWWKMLRWHRPLILSVPDTGATVEMLLDEKTRPFAISHLAGTRADEWSWHRNWFTRQSLGLLLEHYNFEGIELLDNFHRYPAIVMRAWKL